MTRSRLLDAAMIAITLGGVLILLGSLGLLVMLPMMGMMGSMMGAPTGMMSMMMVPFALVGLAAGAVILYAAFRIHRNPDDARSWGTVAIIAGLLSLLAMGGFLLGAASSVTGGVLALLASRRAEGGEPPLTPAAGR